MSRRTSMKPPPFGARLSASLPERTEAVQERDLVLAHHGLHEEVRLLRELQRHVAPHINQDLGGWGGVVGGLEDVCGSDYTHLEKLNVSHGTRKHITANA